MPLTAYAPLDQESYRRNPQSVPFSPDLEAGVYVFVQDVAGTVRVAPDGPHVHPTVLGRRQPAVSAGELTLGEDGLVLLLNNLSGTFACHADCLLVAIGGLVMQGAQIAPDAVRPYEA